MELKKLRRDIDFKDKVEELSEESLNSCIQCGTCAAGCPFVEEMDILPERVFKHIILGNIEKVLEHNTMWICAACYTCSVRCPRDIDIAKIMEGVRQVILRADIDEVDLDEVDNIGELPQLALVGCFRKETG